MQRKRIEIDIGSDEQENMLHQIWTRFKQFNYAKLLGYKKEWIGFIILFASKKKEMLNTRFVSKGI